MTTVTWALLTPDERALLDKLARALLAGDEWVQTPETLDGISQGEYGELLDTHKLIEWNPLNTRFKWLGERITPAGLAVWQQGQAASAPRSVWVAKCRDTIISVHATSESSRLICEEMSGEKLEWETCDVYPDGTHRMVDNSYVYSVEEWRVLP